MTTLVISAPWYKTDKVGNNIGKPGRSGSWETYFATGKGLKYMLYQEEHAKLELGSSEVVLLRNDQQPRRAEARLTNLVQTGQSKNGQWLYDVCFEGQTEVPYAYHLPHEQLKRNGVKLY
jgi:hypothetical protein